MAAALIPQGSFSSCSAAQWVAVGGGGWRWVSVVGSRWHLCLGGRNIIESAAIPPLCSGSLAPLFWFVLVPAPVESRRLPLITVLSTTLLEYPNFILVGVQEV